MPLDGASTCQLIRVVLHPADAMLAIHVKRRDPHTWKNCIPSIQGVNQGSGEESLRRQVPKSPQGVTGRLWGSTFALWSQNGESAIELFLCLTQLLFARTLDFGPQTSWSLEETSAWNDYKENAFKWIFSIGSKLSRGRGGDQLLSLGTLLSWCHAACDSLSTSVCTEDRLEPVFGEINWTLHFLLMSHPILLST